MMSQLTSKQYQKQAYNTRSVKAFHSVGHYLSACFEINSIIDEVAPRLQEHLVWDSWLRAKHAHTGNMMPAMEGARPIEK